MLRKSKFIVFEGVDASGKSTVSQMLFDKLNGEKTSIYKTAEPTNSPIGSIIRNILNKRIVADEKTIGALFVADRLDHLNNPINGILSYLDKGIHVISDRYYYSSYAYHVPHLSMDYVIAANKECADILRPDIVFYLDISVEESLRRLNASRQFLDLFETKERITSVVNNYKEAIRREGEKDNVVIIDGEQPVEEVFSKVLYHTEQIMGLHDIASS